VFLCTTPYVFAIGSVAQVVSYSTFSNPLLPSANSSFTP